MSLNNIVIFSVYCASIICCAEQHSDYGFLGLCLIAWISFFALMLMRDYSGGLFIHQMAQVFLAVLAVVLCRNGNLGDLGRASLLAIIPVFSVFALWEFYRRLKKGTLLDPFLSISQK